MWKRVFGGVGGGSSGATRNSDTLVSAAADATAFAHNADIDRISRDVLAGGAPPAPPAAVAAKALAPLLAALDDDSHTHTVGDDRELARMLAQVIRADADLRAVRAHAARQRFAEHFHTFRVEWGHRPSQDPRLLRSDLSACVLEGRAHSLSETSAIL